MDMDTGILDTMLATIAGYTTGSSGTITGYATSLYGILILLDFILAVLLNIGEIDHIKQLVRKVLFYGFWIWIIREWGTLCDALLDSLMITGTAIGGVDASVLKSPSTLIDAGLYIAKPYMDYASEMSWLEITTSPLNWLMAIIGYAGVVLAFGILALQIFITYVEFYIASALLLIFIPWGSFKYTSFVAEKAIGAVISYGTKLMMLGAVYGLSSGIINSMTVSLTNGEPTPGAVLSSMLGLFALCLLCWQAPGMAAGLMTGAPTLSAGTAVGTAVAGFAGAAAGGSAGAGIGSMAMSTGSSAARAGAALAGAATAGSTAGGPGAGGAAGAMSGAAGFAASAFKSAASNATQGVRGAFASGQASVAASGGSSSGSSAGGSVSGSGGASGSAAGSSCASTSASGSGSTGSSAASSSAAGAAQSMGAGSSAGAGSSTGGASGSAQTASAFASNASGSTKSAAAQGNTSTNAFSTAGNSSAGGSSAKTASSFAAGEASGGSSTSSHASASAAFQKAIDETKQAVPPEASPQGGFSVPLPKDND
jgi:type IV secretion system protein TrbL